MIFLPPSNSTSHDSSDGTEVMNINFEKQMFIRI
ncbi:hypothetical protein M7I_6204 [Glarea lozoyensis 74030]|uniref:Uncharacterized protein n=1 Tax=Glarea lozoyensis (strain ATCC 74030 / MF5533) TaxID=1104152 RepID=H0ETY0_GLAL7|nr:hypothetical protein M7I_6204 [Glarea lozoyensis 74030]